jgi:RNA polymerase sigma factor (sigma-70 family)
MKKKKSGKKIKPEKAAKKLKKSGITGKRPALQEEEQLQEEASDKPEKEAEEAEDPEAMQELAGAEEGETDEAPARPAKADGRGSASKDSLMLYFDEIRDEKILTEKEEKDLVRKAKKGDVAARASIIKANLKLVVKMAKKYEYLGVPIIDLIEEGNIGLMKAVEKFKPELGFRFSTYGTWWIKQSINRAIANQKNTIRIPVHILDIYHKYLKLIEKEIKDTGRFPERDDIARKLKIEPMKLNEILNIIKAPKSLDLEYENEDSDSARTLKDTIEDESIVKPDDEFFEKDKKEKMLELIAKLKPKEQEVIMSRFGLSNRNILTLEEIGVRLKLTRERIRQIETIAIKKLRYLMKNKESI